ncbi:nuclear transport factor 2 family protein [Streptomyces sp. NPDC058613]|uniref:nuclear transport factor 2 family protein n=1 Tax=unclassified Streptomyces TaxID=2593676 RepID=UPI003663778F
MTNLTASNLTTDSRNVRNVKALYLALADRDLPGAQRLLVEEPVWDITPGSPDGGVYRGMAEVFGSFYPKLAARFRSLEVHPDAYVDGGDTVVASGYYQVTEQDAEESKLVRFAHVFGITDEGRIKGVWQVADTALFAEIA